MIPDFIDIGVPDLVLPPGIHTATLEDIADKLGEGSRRQSLISNLTSWRENLLKQAPNCTVYIDGSFVTSRALPNDIDASVWIPEIDMPDSSEVLKKQALFQFFIPHSKQAFNMDAYPVAPVDVTHPAYGDFKDMKDWTETFWSAYKGPDGLPVANKNKGYLEVIS